MESNSSERVRKTPKIYNELYDNIDKKCYYHLKKNGKTIFRFKPNRIECILNNIQYYDNIFTHYVAKNENDILEKLLLVLYKAQQENLKYYLINDKEYYAFKQKNIDKIINYCFFKECIFKNKNIKNFFYGNDIKIYCTLFMLYKVQYVNIPNNKILNCIFYEHYIHEIKDEIYRKYGKKLNNFQNYHELYIFFKKIGEVDLFYNKYAKIFIKNYRNFYIKYISLKNDTKYKIFEKKFIKKVLNFKDIDLLDIIENKINNKFDKKYIKNKFMELTKNIGKI
jgi:hypothetical protein